MNSSVIFDHMFLLLLYGILLLLTYLGGDYLGSSNINEHLPGMSRAPRWVIFWFEHISPIYPRHYLHGKIRMSGLILFIVFAIPLTILSPIYIVLVTINYELALGVLTTVSETIIAAFLILFILDGLIMAFAFLCRYIRKEEKNRR